MGQVTRAGRGRKAAPQQTRFGAGLINSGAWFYFWKHLCGTVCLGWGESGGRGAPRAAGIGAASANPGPAARAKALRLVNKNQKHPIFHQLTCRTLRGSPCSFQRLSAERLVYSPASPRSKCQGLAATPPPAPGKMGPKSSLGTPGGGGPRAPGSQPRSPSSGVTVVRGKVPSLPRVTMVIAGSDGKKWEPDGRGHGGWDAPATGRHGICEKGMLQPQFLCRKRENSIASLQTDPRGCAAQGRGLHRSFSGLKKAFFSVQIQ